MADPDSLPDEEAQRRERASLLQSCIEALPAKHQQVIHLRFYVDDSLGGVAAALGCSVGTVKSRLFHALDKPRGRPIACIPGDEHRSSLSSHRTMRAFYCMP